MVSKNKRTGKAKACKWSKAKFERCLKGAEKSIEKYGYSYTKYQVCNDSCLKKTRRKKR